MKITVVTVTYNVADQLGATLASIREQTYPDIELIVVDGGSTDGPLAVAERFAGPGVLIVSEADRGIYDAMNKGVALASGEYVNFMNAGDAFADSRVVARVAAAARTGGEDYLYGNVVSVYGVGEKLAVARPPGYVTRNKPFNHQALFARRNWLERLPFDLRYRYVADYDQTYAAYRAGATFRHLPLTVARVNMTEGASKRSFWATAREKIAVNWRRAASRPAVIVYLAGHLPYLAALYGLRKLGVFEALMAWRGRRQNPDA